MTRQSTKFRPSPRQPEIRPAKRALFAAGAAALLILAALGIWQFFRSSAQFVIQGGEKEAIVLLRNDEDVVYEFVYTGDRPVSLDQVLVMLEGQILHVDVAELALRRGGEELVLDESGRIPEGRVFTLQPGEAFELRVTYLGRTLGGNFIYGFRIGYSSDGGARVYELRLNQEYAVFVE